MSQFHSTVSRRQFMKGMSVVLGGAGAASLVNPVYHDLDEMVAAGSSGIGDGVAEKRPWWVKEREYLNPVSDIDWDLMQRFVGPYDNMKAHLTDAEYTARNTKRLATRKQYITNNEPGNTLRDYALRVAAWSGIMPARMGNAMTGINTEFSGETKKWVIGDNMHQQVSAGFPQWQGTPEENSMMLRAASRFFGGAACAFGELHDNTTRKLTFGDAPPGVPLPSNRNYNFEDVDQPYVVPFKKSVIPLKFKYVALTNIMQDLAHGRTSPSGLMEAGVGKGYDQNRILAYRMSAFLHAIGWNSVEGDLGSILMRPGYAEVAGLGEVGRIAAQVVTPECGPGIRLTHDTLTNLPLAPTNPIDFGVSRFCESACKKCADACPGRALPYGSKRWEMTSPDDKAGNPSFLKVERFNQAGKKTFWLNHFACHEAWVSLDNGCNVCTAVCVFSREMAGTVHEFVKPIVATTSLFNGFFFNMDKAFGYGVLPKEHWEDFWTNPTRIVGDNY
ncbi:MAG: reductive dehalogenase [Dehalogenimonas sp.]